VFVERSGSLPSGLCFFEMEGPSPGDAVQQSIEVWASQVGELRVDR
jgi:hypothetical protein